MNEKILIVDDDLESLKLIGLMLQRRGYQIVAAPDGPQALTKAESEHPDLIILDVMMPGMDGYEVCRRLRANPATAQTPIIMFTAKTTVSDKVTGFQAGADDYLTKPIHPAELASRVEAVLLRSGRARPTGAPAPVAHARIIGFLGCKGGVGTTTLALNAAIIMKQEASAQKPAQVALAELMAGSGAIGLQIGMTRQVGIANLLSKRVEDIDAAAVEAQLTVHTSGVKILLAPSTPRTGGLPAAHAKVIVQHLAAQNDLLLLDMGAGLDDGTRAAVQLCHYLIIALEAQRVALTMAQNLLTELEALRVPRSNIGLVLINRTPSASSFTRSAIESMLQSTMLTVIPPAPELAFQASESGTPLVIMQPNSLVSTQIKEMARRIIK